MVEFDPILGALRTKDTSSGSYLPLTGGTLTGTLDSQSVIPTANATYTLGDSSHYYEYIYGTRLYLSSGAYLDGGTAGTVLIDGTLEIDATSATGIRLISNGNNGLTLDNSSLSGSPNNWNIKCGSDGTFLFDQGGGLSGRFKLGGTSSSDYFDWTPDFSNSYFKVAGDKSVKTFNSTLDDGSGNATMGTSIHSPRVYLNGSAYFDGSSSSGQVNLTGTLFVDSTSNTGIEIVSNGNNGLQLNGGALGKNSWALKQGSDGTFLFDQGGGLNGRFKLGGAGAGTYFDWTPDYTNSYFKVADNKAVTTYNNTLDDGSGNMIVTGLPKFAGTNTTGGGTALLGTNSPATTNTAPYTWIEAKSSDGSTVYIPAWK